MHLRVAVPPDYVFYNYAVTENNRTTHHGLVFNILQSLAKKFNFTYEVVPAETYGVSDNGLAGMVANKVANMAIGPIAPTYERQRVVDFLTPYHYQPVFFATYQESPGDDGYAAFRPLSINTALVIALTWIMTSLVVTVIARTHGDPKYLWRLLTDITIDMFGAGFKQSVETMQYSTSSLQRMVFTCWNLVSLVVTTLYVSLVIAMAAVPLKPPTIDTVEELASRTDIKVMVHGGTSMLEVFRQSNRGSTAKIFKNQIDPYPEILLKYSDPQSAIIKRLASGKHALVETGEFMSELKNLDCSVSVAKERLFGHDLAFAITQGSPLKAKFDKHLLDLLRSGIVSHWFSNYEKTFIVDNCKKSMAEKKTPTIGINIIFGPLLALMIGVVCAMFVFIIELMVKK